MAFQIPSKIYLQIQDIDTDEPIQSLDGCTWCADRIMKTDVEYVLLNDLQAENARLREDNAALEARTAHLSTFRSEALGAMQESRDVIHNLRAENERLKWQLDVRKENVSAAELLEAYNAENERLREALQALVDEQNDAPLERRRAEWEKAIEKAKNALK